MRGRRIRLLLSIPLGSLVVAVGLAACSTDEAAPDDTPSTGPTEAPTETPAQASSPVDDGTPVPAATAADSHLTFDGLDDRVLVPWDASFPTEVFTVSAWIRLPQPPGQRAAIIARGEDDDSFNLSWQLYVGPEGDLTAMLEASNENNYCYPANDCVPFGSCESGDLFVADGAWHHVALTRDESGELVFYIDGQERARCQGTGTPSSNNQQFLSFGATHGSVGRLPAGAKEPPVWFLPGEIDDPAMWNRSLTAAEIEAVQRDGVDPASPGLVGFWSLDEGQGQDVHDLSPALNDGYLGANPDADSADPAWTPA
ncbi:MAG: LamG domain-containing protein [Chloroflexi bacterium]|nr:LamG domain-containing protein [Chloroflexota bacterium]MCI0783025.1 LamG domain-containing protein [Chloroflexota bacterium]MCI0813605.1 LamG domain-containing protein [Chloroflexota bacterium]MCI0817495.1 LamG domain-containing protein [Chloroflexota bacterium]MCI0820019.1 LamG domain-containing protein [Chloroflexota bacterium]